jgi:hypothetical protein
MANKIQRAWFVDKLLRIGIVEEAINTVTKDGFTSKWKSISEAKDLRIYAVSRDEDLSINALVGTFEQIPAWFHEAIVHRAIAIGYKDPRNLDIKASAVFDGEFVAGLKLAKKYSKSNYQTTGRIRPQDF